MNGNAVGERKTAGVVTPEPSPESLAALALQAIPDPLIVVDGDFRIRLANASFCKTFDIPPQTIYEQFMQDLPDAGWEAVRDVLAERSTQRSPISGVRIDFQFANHRRTFSLSAHPIEETQPSSGLTLLQLEDVTLRRKREAARDMATADLERSNTDLEQFAYVASHDLQEPLRMVASFTQLLAKRYQGQLDAEADEFIGYAVDGARRMQALVNDLLAYSRVGRRELKVTSIDFEKVVATLQQDLRSAISDSAAAITHDPLPTLEADPLQLRQLLQNLLANAIKFRGKEPPQVHLSAVEGSSEWTIAVRDNGIGIPEGQRDRIFDIFQRLHSRSEYPGTGIGLAVCKKIVERHGGRIWVESAPDYGTIFLFTLPRKRLRKDGHI